MKRSDKIIWRETQLIIFSAFIGAFMGNIVNQVLTSTNFLFDLLMALAFLLMMYVTVPIALRKFLKLKP